MQEHRPEIVIIAAVASSNRVIGRDGAMPWHISADLRRFKQLTYGHPVIMGRRTVQSVLDHLGGPLPGRQMLMLTSGRALRGYPEIRPFDSLESAIAAASTARKIYICGGAAVYAAALPIADTLELTLVEGTYAGDAFFPPYEHLLEDRFHLTEEERHSGYRFVTYRRRRPGQP